LGGINFATAEYKRRVYTSEIRQVGTEQLHDGGEISDRGRLLSRAVA